MKNVFMLLLSLCVAMGISSLAFADEHHHEGDWSFGIIGGAAAVIEPEPEEAEPIHLHPFIEGLYHGDWGVQFWNLPNPDLKSVRILFTQFPLGLFLYHEDTLLLGDDGENTPLGYFDMSWPDPGIHHAHIDAYATAPGTYTVCFKLVNAIANDGNYTPLLDSEEYCLDFTVVPEPSSLLALAGASALALFKKRKQ